MTRGERILALVDEKEKELTGNGYSAIYTDGYSDGFLEGAHWADNNPNWHKYPDEKPKEEKHYLVYTSFDDMRTDYFEVEDEDWFCYVGSSIVAWMELPEPPKFD